MISKVITLLILLMLSLHGQDLDKSLDDLTFDDLLDIKVVSFDGTPKKWKKTPAAAYVISKEEIASSSARSIADLLRGIPGIHVGQIDAQNWAISSRGFTRRFSNKLLVLIDGRSVYTPLFSGVHWDIQNIPLSTIERIEIIRGPGGSLWGANAVNGVINIITKSAVETQGSYLRLGGGNIEPYSGTYRFGELIENSNLAYRLTLSANQLGNFKRSDGSNKPDDMNRLRLSGRVDWEPDAFNKFMFSAGTYKATAEEEINYFDESNTLILDRENDIDTYAHYFLTRWERTINDRSSFSAQVYYDEYKKEAFDRYTKVRTYDLELRYIHELNDIHKLTLGTGYRIVRDDINNSEITRFLPERTQRDTFSLFAQDEITILKNELSLILGTKYERNDHTGTEWQPSAKLIWTPNEEHTFWGSIARSVRTPSRADEDLVNRIRFVPGPTELVTTGDRGLESERQISYELGYRYTPEKDPYSIDLTVFYNDFNHHYTTEFTGSGASITDDAEGFTTGAEGYLSYFISDKWKLSTSYSYLFMNISGSSAFRGGTPEHMASLKSEYKFTEKVSFIKSLYYFSHFASHRNEYSDAYRLDLGFKWQLSDQLTFSAWGTNLLDPQTREYGDAQTPTAEIPRAFYLQLEWNF